MKWVLSGVAVTVLSPSASTSTTTTGEYDPFGAWIAGVMSETTVANVLVDNPTSEDIEQSTRQHGVSCDLLLHFPKKYHGSLRGCMVALPEPWSATYEVLGDPQPYDPELTPGEHDRKVQVRRVAG